ncbi:MAG: hypothetical protein RIE22_07580 [Alphaproteobacteria bacterium]
MRRSTLFSLAFALLLGIFVFAVKYQVMDLEREVTQLNRDILSSEEAIHVLEAEWSFLNQPDRLRKLSGKYLDLAPARSDQFITLDAFRQRYPDLPATPRAPARPEATSRPGPVASHDRGTSQSSVVVEPAALTGGHP